MKERLADCLSQRLGATLAEVEDESVLHAGHHGASGGGHFNVTVVAALFEGKSRMERHRLVYDAVFGDFPGQVHALSVRAFSPEEWGRRGD